MFILSITPGQIANTVWTAANRTITGGIGASAHIASNPSVTVAAGAQLDLRPTGIWLIRYLTIVWSSGSAGVSNIMMFYSGGSFGGEAIPAGTWASRNFVCTQPAGIGIYNQDTTHTLPLGYVAFDYS